MVNSINKEPLQTKSYSSIYDLNEASQLKKKCGKYKYFCKPIEVLSTFPTLAGDVVEKKSPSNVNSETLNETSYVTSERYHSLNKKSSDKSVIRSTSTFFYDLDSLVKRHSYHCTTELSESKNNLRLKHKDVIKNGFGAKSEAIVQECATQIKPRLLSEKTVKENRKKDCRSFPNDLLLSSEIFLRDNDSKSVSYKPQSDDIPVHERHQKFWSFAKYRTEYTNPVAEQKKTKSKDRGKRTEDPCPCQLFSYACPCTNKKSLTELASNSKSLTVVDQATNTSQIIVKDKKLNKCNKHKKTKDVIVSDDKRTSTVDINEKKCKEELSSDLQSCNINNNVPKRKSDNIVVHATKIKSARKPRQVMCPNCKVLVDVMSATEEAESLKPKSSPLYRENDMSATATYTFEDIKGSKSKVVESRDTCTHDPQCELIPVCQILPTDNIYGSPNISNKQSPMKPNPRVIRITKGCRHHPPCTVVPSCQKINVLNNNCEYIPPCLHRPRCVNLPLCAPLSKSIYYEDYGKLGQDLGITECRHLQPNRLIPTLQDESLENPINGVQNTCEYVSECSPRFMVNSTLGCLSPTSSPCHPVSLCKHCKSEKSCQFDYLDWQHNCIEQEMYHEHQNRDEVIFIRDVGCQFRNKSYSPKDSIIQYKTSSDSFNCVSMNVDKYYENYHTIRYEDKCTIPISGEEQSVTTLTISSTEIDSQCPKHGRGQNQNKRKGRAKGFVPRPNTLTPFVGCTRIDPQVNFCLFANDSFKEKLENKNPTPNDSTKGTINRHSIVALKSRSSFLKGKYKSKFPIRRRKASLHTTLNQV